MRNLIKSGLGSLIPVLKTEGVEIEDDLLDLIIDDLDLKILQKRKLQKYMKTLGKKSWEIGLKKSGLQKLISILIDEGVENENDLHDLDVNSLDLKPLHKKKLKKYIENLENKIEMTKVRSRTTSTEVAITSNTKSKVKWTKHYDKASGRNFWFSEELNESTWDNPEK